MSESPTTPTKPETEEREHHVFSPSTLQSLEACSCYRSRGTANIAAILGTLQHKVTETGEDDMSLSDDRAAAAAECMDFFERRRQLMIEERQRAVDAHRASPQGALVPLEKAVPACVELREELLAVDNIGYSFVDNNPLLGRCGAATPITLTSTTAGYIDRGLINYNRTRAELFDWKFGMWPVEAAHNNLQGIAYALGLFRRYPTVNEITFFFKQPHLNLLSQVTWTRADIAQHYLRILTVVSRAIAARKAGDFKTATPMIPNCLFCAAVGVCPKVTELACRVGSKFFPVEIPEDITPGAVLPPAEAAKGLKLAQVVAVWADAFKRQNTDRVLRGDVPVPPGFKIQTTIKREIVDVQKVREVALRHVTEKEFESTLSCTLGAVEELIHDKTPRGGKTHAVEQFGKELKDAGAVQNTPPIVFLRSVAPKDKTEQTTKETEN